MSPVNANGVRSTLGAPSLGWRNALLYVSPFLFVIETPLPGRLTAIELLNLVVLPLLLVTRQFRLTAQEKQFYILASLWLLGAVSTDLIREAQFEDYSRGWLRIVILIINFTVFRWLIGRSLPRAVTFLSLLFVALAIRVALGVGTYEFLEGELQPWRFGYGNLFFTAVLFFSSYLMSSPFLRAIGLTLPLAAAGLNLVLDARGLFGISALSALIFIATARRKRPISPAAVGAFSILGMIGAVGLVAIYSYTASSGLLGPDAQRKYELQSQGDGNVILGGRSELYGSLAAIEDSPIFGHGSWARDPTYAALRIQSMRQAGIRVSQDDIKSDYIPTHSHLFGSWVEAGILGAAFWLWALVIAIRGIYRAVRMPSPLSGFIAFVGFSLMWDILFSPISNAARVLTIGRLSLMMFAARINKEEGLLAKERKLSVNEMAARGAPSPSMYRKSRHC